jgi:caa(3)-type oxidase subunit IV
MTHAEAQPAGHHISRRTYLIVFAWLAAMTAIEVLVAALPLPEIVTIIVLVTLAIIKAALVVLYYMHLRYDSGYYWIILIVPIFFVLLLGRYLLLR